MARTHPNSLPHWTFVTLSQIKVPRPVGELVAFAGYSLYPLERLDCYTDNGIHQVLLSHPIRVVGTDTRCVGGLLSLQLARYRLDPETRIPVLRFEPPPDVSDLELAATDLVSGLVLFGGCRPCRLEAMAALRHSITHSPHADDHLVGLENVTRFARMIGRTRSDVSTAVTRVREALEEVQ